jgi:AcrR family transcriptional regulator
MSRANTDQRRSRHKADRSGDSGMRVRRHGAELENALLQAAWDEARAAGYAGLTMEGVAARAGTGKAVLYRRWPRRAELVLAAMRHHVGSITSQIPDTGDLREDVLIVLRQIRDRAEQIGPDIIHGLRMEAHDLPPEALAITPAVMMTLLTRAAERGDIRLEKITPLIAALPGILVRHELFLSNAAVSEAYLTEIVDSILLPLVTTADGE